MKNYLLIVVVFIKVTYAAAQLSGNYTIGGTTPDYATFNDAVTALTDSGISGPVIFNVRDGVYPEKLIIPVIDSASAVNTITFQSQSGDSSLVILTDSSSTAAANNYTLHLNGADYITFKNMTIRRTGTATYGSVILINNGAVHNNLLNNWIIGTAATTLNANGSLIYSAAAATSDDSSNTFSHNRFENGSYGIYYYGASAAILESGTVISDNKFINMYGRGIQLGNQIAPLVTGNEITTNSTLATFYCMYFTSCDTGMQIERNKMSAPNGGYGMYFTASNGTGTSIMNVVNNFIHVGGTATAYGIYLTGSSFINFRYNSVHVSSTGVTSRCFFPTGATTTKLFCQNNVFANTGGGQTYYIAAANILTLSTSNFNDLYSNGTSLAYWDAAPITDLAEWQAITVRDLNSVSADPVFASAANLHAFGTGINNAGIPLAAVTLDIDGEVRSLTTPDIGADEFAPLADNLAVTDIAAVSAAGQCGDSVTVVTMTLENIGSAAQSNIPIQVNITGADTLTLYDTIPGPLAPDSSIQITFLQTFNSTTGGQFNFMGFSSLGNDQYLNNDTINAVSYFYSIPNSPQVVSPQQVCDNNVSITAAADSGSVVFWYDQPTGGNLLQMGSPFTPTLSSDSVFYVEAREGSGSGGCLRITESELGTNDVVEIQNLSGAGFDATGWIVAVSNNYTNINIVNANTWQLGYFNAGEVMYKGDQAGANYWGSNILWANGNTGWVMLIDPAGTLVDFMVWGFSDSVIQNLNVTVGGFNITVGQAWSGAGITSCAVGTSISRIGSSDANSLTDFACETNTIGTQNVNLSPTFANCGMGPCGSIRIPVDVTLIPGVSVNLGNDTAIGSPINYVLDAGTGFTSYLWSDSSTSQTFTATQLGTYWVTVVGGNGCSFTDSITIGTPLTVQTSISQDLVNVFPNPASDLLNIEIAGEVKADRIQLTDAEGRIVFESNMVKRDNLTSLSIDTRDFNAGIYFLHVVGEKNIGMVKVFVNRN